MRRFSLLLICSLLTLITFGKEVKGDFSFTSRISTIDCDKPNKLTFENDTLFFDTIMDGEIVNFTFNFTVTGCDTIKIHQVYTGCSCTSPAYDSMPLAPGHKGKIDITFKSKGWGDKTGNLAIKHVYVLYNGGSQPIFFKGVVVKPE